MLTIQSHPFLMLILGSALTVLGRFVYVQWLSKSSRVTKEKCDDNRALCVASTKVQIDTLDASIRSLGTREFQITATHTLKLILMTLAELCAAGEGCEERTRERIREEMMR